MKINPVQNFKQFVKKPKTKVFIGRMAIAGLITAVPLGCAYFVVNTGLKMQQKSEKRDSITRADEQARQAILMDSIAQTNYAKGMQAVKDSIARGK